MGTDISFEFGCVYFFKSIEKNLLYIGKTYNLKNKLYQHLSDSHEWKKDIYYVEYMIIENEVDRDIIETYCINLYKPTYNKDKVYSNIKPTLQIVLPTKELVLKSEIVKTTNKRNEIGNFKDCCIHYLNNPEDREAISKIYPLIEQAYNSIGFEKMQALEFIQKDIQNQLVATTKLKNLETNILSLLDYKIGDLLDKSDVKNKLQGIYNVLEINKKAKATDLSEWYVIKNHNKTINGKSITKLKIISCKNSK